MVTSPFVLRHYSELIVDVIAVEPKENYLLHLTFADGQRREFDMKPLIQIKPWTRIAPLHLFCQVRVDYGTVVWPQEIDIAPETLLIDSVELHATQAP